MKIYHKQTIKNFSGALAANLLSSFISVLTLLLIPKVVGVTEYSYWQLYIFYTTFVGFMHFGWADGVYLKYGGEEYDDLDKKLFSSQFRLLVTLEFIVSMSFVLFALLFIEDADKMLIITLAGLNCLLMNSRTLLQFILQSTNRILTFSRNLIIEKILYVILIVIFLSLGYKDFEHLITADILAKTFMLAILCYTCRDIVFSRTVKLTIGLKEAWNNIGVGLKLMFASIAGMLIIGVVRFSIEQTWGVETFGKISLALTVANLLLVFIGAASVVLFPVIRRTNKANLPKIYSSLRTSLMTIVLGGLVIYYPVHSILVSWLPNYADGLIYMSLLFPICVYESKMSVLITTYLKALRKEKTILVVNITSVILSALGSVITVYWLKDLTLALMVIVLTLALRAILAEFVLARVIDISIKKDIILESALTIIFLTTSWLIGGIVGSMIYLAAYSLYLVIKKKDIITAIRFLKNP